MWARRARARRTSAGDKGRTSARGCDGCHRKSFGNPQAYACPTKGQFNMCNCTGIRDSSRNIRHRPPAARGTARATPLPGTAREGPATPRATPSPGPPPGPRPDPRTASADARRTAPGTRAPKPAPHSVGAGAHGGPRPGTRSAAATWAPEAPGRARRPEESAGGGKARRRAQGAAEGHEGGRSGALGMADGPRARPARHGIRARAPRNPHKNRAGPGGVQRDR